MSRLCLIALALCAVVAAVAAEPAPHSGQPEGHPHHEGQPEGHPHHVGEWAQKKEHFKQWAHKKGEQVKHWAHHEKENLKEAWHKTVVPKIQELKKQYGEKWQEKAPLVAAALKKKAGVYFDKAVQFVNNKLASLGH